MDGPQSPAPEVTWGAQGGGSQDTQSTFKGRETDSKRRKAQGLLRAYPSLLCIPLRLDHTDKVPIVCPLPPPCPDVHW